MEQNKTRSYLFYAFGEIALVMIGILLALQVNNWNQEKNNQVIAQEYIQLLQTDLRADTTMLQDLINDSMRKHDDTQKLMKLYHEDINQFDDTMAVFIAIQDIGRSDSPSFRNNTYEDLVNTGNIKLLKNRATINALMSYYTNDFTDWMEEYIHRLWREYLPHAIELLPSEFLEDLVLIDRGSEIKMIMANYMTEDNQDLPNDIMDSFKANAEMDFLLKSVSRTHLVHIYFLQNSKDRALQALTQLEL